MKIVEELINDEHRQDFKTLYLKYRVGRIKHQYWLKNRKNSDIKFVDEYDFRILQNCQPGSTCFFSSAGYYLKDIWPEIDSAEVYPVVKTFYPEVVVCANHRDLHNVTDKKYDNFAVVNSRIGIVPIEHITENIRAYCKSLNPGARLFYSYRDTKIQYNRLRVDAEAWFLEWAHSLESLGLTLVWHEFLFPKRQVNSDGEYSLLENPDTTNGNLKFWFVYRGDPWQIV